MIFHSFLVSLIVSQDRCFLFLFLSGSSNRDTQFSWLHARVAETAVERNFRSRARVQEAARKHSPLNAHRAKTRGSSSSSLHSLDLAAIFRAPFARDEKRWICTLDRLVARLQERKEREREIGNRCNPFAMGKRDRQGSCGSGHDTQMDEGTGNEERVNCTAWTEKWRR